MPRRTNEFQQLIRFIEEQLAGSGAIVTESKLLTDSVTGEQREVDIVIEIDGRLRPLIVGIECTATARPVDATWVEKIHTKHQHLPIDKTVLVSRSGFRGPALTKANFLNIQTLTLEESQHADWIDQVKATRVIFFMHELPVVSRIAAYFHPRLPAAASEHVDPLAWSLYREDGKCLGTIVDAVTAMIQRCSFDVEPSVYRPELEGFDVEGHIRADERFYKVDPAGNELDIVAFDVAAFIKVETGIVELTPAQYGTANIVHGTGASESFGVSISAVQSRDWVPGQPIEAGYRVRVPERLAGCKLRVMPIRVN